MAKVVWADPAIQDLDAIADYIALDRPEAAHRLVREVLAAVEGLQKFPRRGSQPAELGGLPYRQLIVPPCRIIYRVEKKVVYIVHVLRSEQLVRRELFPPQPRVSKSRASRDPGNRRSRSRHALPGGQHRE
jgi:toxin ParE1/3/4